MKNIFNTLYRRGPESEARVNVKINGGEYEIDELADFDSEALEGKRFRDMKFEASHGKTLVVVELLPGSGRVSEMRDEDDVVMTGVSEKIQEIAKDRENHLKFIGVLSLLTFGMIPFYSLAARLLVDPIVATSSTFGYPISEDLLLGQELLGFICAIFYIPAMILVMKKMKIKGNVLVNSPKGKSRLFRDKLVENWQVSAFWAVIGAVVGSYVGRILS
ncbi:hypothetical protein HFP72_18360 [Nocardiopsis sp. ARC36]